MKKLFFLFALSLCSLGAWAQTFNSADGTLTFTITGDNTVSVAEGPSTLPAAIVIPDSVENDGTTYMVTSIGKNAFYTCGDLTSVTIPNSVTSIGQSGFSGCSNLSSVTIGNSVTTIGQGAFRSCSSLTSVTIPNSVTSIGTYAFHSCSSLTSVTIGNSVTSIGNQAFTSCSSLTSVTIPHSVTSIGNQAFSNCSYLYTIYNLSDLPLSTGSSDYGRVAYYAKRVIKFDTCGTGTNKLLQIPGNYSVVSIEDDQQYHIPLGTIPDFDNLIYKESNGDWKAKNIVLTDDSSAFVAPVEFTAAEVTYTREFTNSNRSTLYLPFAVAEASMPQNLEVYEFSNFNGSSLSFSEHTGDIAAYTPYLVGYDLSKDGNTTQCTFSLTNVTFSATPTSPAGVTINDMTFKGTTQRTCMNSSNYGYRDGFFVQSADGSSSDHGTHAHVNPFRAYFEIAPSSASQGVPPVLNVELGYGDPVGIEAVETPEQEYDGRYGKDVYDMMGRLVRKNADNLKGLPRGIYIWKGKKVMNYDF